MADWKSVKLKFESKKDNNSSQDLYRSNKGVMSSLASSNNSNNNNFDDVVRWEIEENELDLSNARELGRGAFGTVFKGKLRGKEVAIKKLNCQEFDDETLQDFKQEVQIMSKLRHPNVVLFMGTCLTPGNYMIVTEYMPRGSLYDVLHDKSVNLSFKRKMKMAKDAALGMTWLHQSKPPFIHRDLKTQNLLVDSNLTVKISDFGLSHMKKEAAGTVGNYGAIGTPLWMAPEVLLNKEYDESADVYSFGIVLWELLTGKNPFPQVDSFNAMIDLIVNNDARPEIPDTCPERLAVLIQACWDSEPANRPTFTEIVPQFDAIIVDAIINDKNGRRLWSKYFMKDKLRETVSWKNFVIAFTNLFKSRAPKNPDDTRWKCLKALLTDSNEKVSVEQFSRILEWFGPLEGLDILDRVEDVLKRDWFHGEISSSDSEKKLSREKKGTFLVRFSSRDPGCYAISVVSQGGRLKHYRIYHKPGLDYLIGKSECDSLETIIEKYRKDLYLKYPCPGSPYEEIFNTDPVNISAGYLVPDFD